MITQHANKNQVFYSCQDLFSMQIEKPAHLIQDIVPFGVTVLAGRPKAGKSHLAFYWAASIASGNPVLTNYDVHPSEVFYLSLEDNLFSLQEKVLKYVTIPAIPLYLTNEWNFGNDNVSQLRKWCATHPDCKLIVIDTMQKIRPLGRRSNNWYEDDYLFVSQFKSLYQDTGVSTLLVHHTTKAKSDNSLDDVSGTSAITGAADTVITMSKKMNGNRVIEIVGRWAPEQKIITRWNSNKQWILAEEQMSPDRKLIIEILSDGTLHYKEIGEKMGKNPNTIYKLLVRMASDDQIQKLEDGHFSL